MKYSSISAFVAVARTGSVSAAARELSRSRSQLSAWISDLEAEWGVDVLDRSTYRPTLSDAGKKLLPYCEIIVNSANGLKDAVVALKHDKQNLTIGIDCFLPTSYRTAVASACCRLLPESQLEIKLLPLSELRQALSENTIDLAVGPFLPDDGQRALRGVQAALCPYVFCCHPGHPLAQLESVPENLLYASKAILMAGIREHFDVQIYTEMPDYETVVTMLKSGVGWSVVPLEMVKRDIDRGELTILNLISAVGKVPVGAYWHVKNSPDEALEGVLAKMPEILDLSRDRHN